MKGHLAEATVVDSDADANTFVHKDRTNFMLTNSDELDEGTAARIASILSSNRPSMNPVERLFEIAIVTVTLGVTAYLIGWALWLW
jgi:hypothetical protein